MAAEGSAEAASVNLLPDAAAAVTVLARLQVQAVTAGVVGMEWTMGVSWIPLSLMPLQLSLPLPLLLPLPLSFPPSYLVSVQ